jgi:hypothetical protein
MRCRGLAACVLLAGVLGACAAVDPVDSRYDTIGRSLAKARNEAILLNLVRASRNDPLNFTTIANVTPSLSNTSSFALPSFLLGPSPRNLEPGFSPGRDVILGNSTAGNSTEISTNFNVSTQETSAFYSGFLKPIDLEVVDYFIRQDYSRELLFWLFTQSVETEVGREHLLYAYNPPDDYGCPEGDPDKPCFRDMVWLAMYSGLTVEERSVQKTESGRAGNTRDKVMVITTGQSNGNQPAGSGSSKPETIAYFRFCFDKLLARKAMNTMDKRLIGEMEGKYRYVDFKSFRPTCGETWDPRKQGPVQSDTLEFHAGPIKFRIKPRSAFGIFEFLGTLIKMQRPNAPTPWNYQGSLRSEVLEQPPTLTTVHDDKELIRVDSDGGGDCFVYTWFKNESYCVPDGAFNTKRIFNLLAQLIAIQTAATDLSITPTVRIIQ